MATLYDGNGNEIEVNGSGSAGGGSYGGYQPYSYYEAIGDSLTYGSGYPSKVANILQITNVVNHAVNGATLIGEGNNNMISQSQAVSTTCELCTIMGGTNDSANIIANNIGTIGTKDTTTFLGSYQTIIENLLSKNPKMRIILMKPPRRYDMTDISYLEKIGECIDQLHEYYGIPVIDAYNDLGMNEFNYSSFLLEDKLHFNTDGGNLLTTLVTHSVMAV